MHSPRLDQPNPPSQTLSTPPDSGPEDRRKTQSPLLNDRTMALGQGIIFIVSGIWPVIDLRTFQMVTGPKVDGWLVKTVGAMIATVGVVLLSAGKRNRVTPEIAGLGAGCAASLAAIDVVYVARGRISPIYLADALMEACFIAGWAIVRKRRLTPNPR